MRDKMEAFAKSVRIRAKKATAKSKTARGSASSRRLRTPYPPYIRTSQAYTIDLRSHVCSTTRTAQASDLRQGSDGPEDDRNFCHQRR